MLFLSKKTCRKLKANDPCFPMQYLQWHRLCRSVQEFFLVSCWTIFVSFGVAMCWCCWRLAFCQILCHVFSQTWGQHCVERGGAFLKAECSNTTETTEKRCQKWRGVSFLSFRRASLAETLAFFFQKFHILSHLLFPFSFAFSQLFRICVVWAAVWNAWCWWIIRPFRWLCAWTTVSSSQAGPVQTVEKTTFKLFSWTDQKVH